MNAVRVETTVQTDGELHLTELPFRRGDKVEAIVLILDSSPTTAPVAGAKREQERAAALNEFLALARSSSFRSADAYPTRDELHERD
jgi:hypothetical protein